MKIQEKLRYLEDRWDDQVARDLDPPELLRYRSNVLGSDLRITNFGGGNTSSKIEGIDPLDESRQTALWIKGSGGDIGSKNIEAPELRALLENFVSSSDDLAYATLLNSDAKGISAGRIAPDAFLQRELQHAFDAARDGRAARIR